jgi:hypothetical protein
MTDFREQLCVFLEDLKQNMQTSKKTSTNTEFTKLRLKFEENNKSKLKDNQKITQLLL